MDDYDPLTELNSILRTVTAIRETLPGDVPPPAELLTLAWEIVVDEMRALRQAQRRQHSQGGGE